MDAAAALGVEAPRHGIREIDNAPDTQGADEHFETKTFWLGETEGILVKGLEGRSALAQPSSIFWSIPIFLGVTAIGVKHDTS